MQHNTAAWAEFYSSRVGDDYLEYVRERYEPFLRILRTQLRHNDTVLELGCGTGTITRLLWEHPTLTKLVASDIDPAVRKLARKRFHKKPISLIKLDATRVPTLRADIVHSHGMLEHFDDDTIRKVIAAHKHARVQVHYVPGLYDKPSYGDERLMGVDQWRAICNPTEVVTFNDGLDYALIFT